MGFNLVFKGLMYTTATVHVKDAIVVLEKSVTSDFYIMHVTWQTSLLEYCCFFTKTTTPGLTPPPHPTPCSLLFNWYQSKVHLLTMKPPFTSIQLHIHSQEHLHKQVFKLSKEISSPTYYIF